jgi:hypothetical protein
MGAMTSILILLAATSAAEPQVAISIATPSGAVRLEAKDAPLATVLERLAQRLHVELVIEGPRPEANVTTTLSEDGAAAILKALLEPRGIRYATGADADRRIKRLVVVTTGAPKTVIRDEAAAPPEPTSQPFAQSLPEPVLKDHPSPPDEP